MTLELDEIEHPESSCPECKQVTSIRLVYGYPSFLEIHGQCVYGGNDCTPESPTHYCIDCCVGWCLADCPQLFFPFPDECQFCSDSLTAKDRFTFSMAFEEWVDQDNSYVQLSDDTFTASPFPVCATCRHEIRQNKRDLELEGQQEDWQRLFNVCVAVVAGLLFIFTVVYMSQLKG